MVNKLAGLLSQCSGCIRRFQRRQDGLVAVEYSVVLAMLCMILLAIFSENGAFGEMLTSVWDITSERVLALVS